MSRPTRFTLEVLRWQPWLPTVDDTGATPEQLALVAEVAPSPDSRPYYAVLAHDAPVLRERTALFNAIMYGPGGLRRPLWMNRPLRPTLDAFYVKGAAGASGRDAVASEETWYYVI